MPLPKKLLKKTSSWSESSSNPGSNSKNPNDENLFPKSKAIKEKFVFDPEHGGGRRRRDRKRSRITCHDDQLGQGKIRNFQKVDENGLALKKKDEFLSPMPFEIASNLLEETQPQPLQRANPLASIQHHNESGEA